MASIRICSIPGCDKTIVGFEYCSRHYRRFKKYGDPLAGETMRGDPPAFIEAAIIFKGKECLIWPFSKAKFGYGRLRVDGPLQQAHRIVCERVHGPPPSPEIEAAHNCGNTSCVNPDHIRWATHTENMADKELHGTTNRGTRNGRVKLTEDNVREIKRAGKTASYRSIGRRYGVSAASIHQIFTGKSWAWVS